MKEINFGTRYEEYEDLSFETPFKLISDIKRDEDVHFNDMNWHDNVELQWVKEGRGNVIIENKKIKIVVDDTIVINPNEMHYTAYDDYLVYSCLIIDTKFIKGIGVDGKKFISVIKDKNLIKLLNEFERLQNGKEDYKLLKTKKILLEIIIKLCEKYEDKEYSENEKTASFEKIKKVIIYITENYKEKITLEKLSLIALMDKYFLVKEFKKNTGTTIIKYLNEFRCKKATELIRQGYNVSEVAFMCGYNNLSYFIRKYKSIYGVQPSKMKR